MDVNKNSIDYKQYPILTSLPVINYSLFPVLVLSLKCDLGLLLYD